MFFFFLCNLQDGYNVPVSAKRSFDRCLVDTDTSSGDRQRHDKCSREFMYFRRKHVYIINGAHLFMPCILIK
jgi:hypothetical protein